MHTLTPFLLLTLLLLAACSDPSPPPAPTTTNPTSTTNATSPTTAPSTKNTLYDVPILSWNTSGQTTVAGALAAALAVSDHPATYTNIMGDSALAFRLRWYRSTDGKLWNMCSPVGELPDADFSRITGWKLDWKTHFDTRAPKADLDQYASAIARSIDENKPVLAYGQTWDMGVVFGYTDSGHTLLLRDYYKNEQPVELPTKDVKGLLIFIGDYTPPPARRDLVIEALRRATTQTTPIPAEKFLPDESPGHALFHHGPDVYTQWIADINSYDSLTDPQRDNLMKAGWWNFCVLQDARLTAAKYLKDAAPLFDGDTRKSLEHAAGLYDQFAKAAAVTFISKDVFLGPWTGKSLADWTPQTRQKETALLTTLHSLDTAALTDLKSALTSSTTLPLHLK